MRQFGACVTIASTLAVLPVIQATANAEPLTGKNEQAMRAAESALCDKRVALLGETAGHGDGNTLSFKAELVRRLVERCGYRAVMFESSFYDFAEFNRRLDSGQAATREMLSSAVGGLWRHDAAIQPLLDFLYRRATERRVSLVGLDPNLGSAGAFYSLSGLSADISRDLPPPRQSQCHAILQDHIFWRYPKGGPSTEHRTALLSCVDEMGRSEQGRGPTLTAAMIENVRSAIAPDPSNSIEVIARRDWSMYRNFRFWKDRLPPTTKIIVWGATSHMARSASDYPPFGKVRNFGNYVAADFGDDSFALGFSAAAGTYRVGRSKVVAIAPLPANSIEAGQAGASTTIFLDRQALRKFGTGPVGFFDHKPTVANAASALDGLIVFAAERPPEPTNPTPSGLPAR